MLTAGEGYDWFYASEADRHARVRTPITDGAYGKPWVFRFKDLESWWGNRHYNRIGGVEQASPTAWMPEMNPSGSPNSAAARWTRGEPAECLYRCQIGGKRQAEFLAGQRSDSQQRRFLEAHLDHWQSDHAPAGMVDPDGIYVWTWMHGLFRHFRRTPRSGPMA